MTGPARIDQAITPAGLVKSAVAYSLFVDHNGVYAIRTGHGWRMQVRGRHRNERMVDNARRVEAVLDPSNLAGELAFRDGSLFVPASNIARVVLGRRFDQLPDLRFTDGTRTYRFQFDEGRIDEVEAFVEVLSSLPSSGQPEQIDLSDATGERPRLSFEGKVIKTVALPSPCWGATPHIALVGGRIFVQYLSPTGRHHAEETVVYRATYEEHCNITYGRTEMLELCRRLIHEAWGTAPPPVVDAAPPELAKPNRGASLQDLTRALALSITRRENAEQDLGRGGSAEQQDRQERIHRHEVEQASFEWALRILK